MRAVFVHDTYYGRDDQDHVYAFGAFPYRLWKDRFLPHFESLTIIGRLYERPFDPQKLDIASGPHVDFVLLPNINTAVKMLAERQRTAKKIKQIVAQADAVILRGPTEFGMLAAKAAHALNKPVAIEMSGCAFDHSWYHGSLIGKIYAPLKYLRARALVKGADRVIYVTQDFLQKRYPASGQTAFASNVEIDPVDESVLQTRLQRTPDPLRIGLIGNFGNRLKGLHVLQDALNNLQTHVNFSLHVLGQGDPAPYHNAYTHFDGTLPGGAAVQNWLDSIDLYVQPSFHEGLPRALIEAMSRGCPALGSNCGGIPELLDADCIHKKGDARTLEKQIARALTDADWQQGEARRNFARAKNYMRDVLVPRRQKFWQGFARK